MSIRNPVTTIRAGALVVAGAVVSLQPKPAHAAGLQAATTLLQNLESSLTTMVPIIAVIAMMILGILYAMRMLSKEHLVHWFIGVLLIGSASELVSMLLG